MAEEWNSCSRLTETDEFKDASNKYDEIIDQGNDPFQYMMDMQFSLQEALYKRLPNQVLNPNDINSTNAYQWLRDNKIAIDDEFVELIDALPGMSRMDAKDRTAIFKKWKGKYNELRSTKYSVLSDEDLSEFLFEQIDIFHFVLNIRFVSSKLFGEDNLEIVYNRNICTEDITLGEIYDVIRDEKLIVDAQFAQLLTLEIYSPGSTSELESYKKSTDTIFNTYIKSFFRISDIIGLSNKDIFIYYYAKNAENFERIKRGY